MGETKVLLLHQDFSGYSLLLHFDEKINIYFPPSHLVPDSIKQNHKHQEFLHVYAQTQKEQRRSNRGI